MVEPEVAGQVVGAAFGAGLVVFFVTRKLVGPPGVAEVERLKALAGVEEGAGAPKSRLVDWLPWLAGLFAALIGAMSVLAKAHAESPVAAQVAAGQEVLSPGMAMVREGFMKSCMRDCAAEIDASRCSDVCRCAFGELRLKYPTDEAFGLFTDSIATDPERVRTEVITARKSCLANAP